MKKFTLFLSLILFILIIPPLKASANTADVAVYIVVDDNTALRSEPYKKSSVTKRISKDSVIAVYDSPIINNYGNIWYKTLDNNYVYSERITKSSLKTDTIYMIKNNGNNLYLNQYINKISELKNHTKLTTQNKGISLNGTQYFTLDFTTENEVVIKTINPLYAINIHKRNENKSPAVLFSTNKDIETWKLFHHENTYVFQLSSNPSMYLSTDLSSNVFIEQNLNAYTFWNLEEITPRLPSSKNFISKTNAPSLTEDYYSKNNPFSSYSGKGNCTWFAYGRAYEILGYPPIFSGDAHNWWQYKDSYAGYSETLPLAGAVAVWGGKFGHVAIVEKVYVNGDILLSESSYGGVWYTNSYYGSRRYTMEQINGLKGGAANNYNSLPFLGFIYLCEQE